MLVKEIIRALETFAPTEYQESYDNSGLQVGDPEAAVSGILLTLDITEAVVLEAIELGCNLVIAHHPLLFSGLKRITGRTYVERVVQAAIRHNISLYAAHTNLDNMRNGVNAKIAEKLGLTQTSVLAPTHSNLYKLFTYAPEKDADRVKEALFAAGAGAIGAYSECSFSAPGTGTFRPDETASPAIGQRGGLREAVTEVMISVLVPQHLRTKVLQALLAHHPYEEVAYEWIALHNTNQEIGAGIIGMLSEPLQGDKILQHIRQSMKTECIRYTALPAHPIRKVAVCGGSGSFLLPAAISAGADLFITADFKYHQFFDAEDKIVIADIGHYESEQFTVEIFENILTKNFPNFAIFLSKIRTNPIKYYN